MMYTHLLLFSFLVFFAAPLVSMEKQKKIENLGKLFCNILRLPTEIGEHVTADLASHVISEKIVMKEEQEARGSMSFKYESWVLGLGKRQKKYKWKIVYVDPNTQRKSRLSFGAAALPRSPWESFGKDHRCMGPFDLDDTRVVMIDNTLTLFPASSNKKKRIKIDALNAALEEILIKDECCTSVNRHNGTLYTVKSDGSVDSLVYKNNGSFVRSPFKPPLPEVLIKKLEQSFIDAIHPQDSHFVFKHRYDFNINNPNFLLDIYPHCGGLCGVIDRKGNTHKVYGRTNSRGVDPSDFTIYSNIWSGPSVETGTMIGTKVASAVREISISLAPHMQFLIVAAAHHFCSLEEGARSVETAKDIIDRVKEIPLGSERYQLVWYSEKDGEYALKDVYTWLKRNQVKRSTRLYD